MICVTEQERFTYCGLCFFFEEEEEGAELSATTVSLGATLVLHQLWNELLIPTCLASVV